MKRLGMILTAMALVATMTFAQSNNQVRNSSTGNINFEQLSAYLDLQPNQMYDVANINSYFGEQLADLNNLSSPARQAKQFDRAVYGNLKLMKGTLTSDQYRKYVALINLTNNKYLWQDDSDTYYANR